MIAESDLNSATPAIGDVRSEVFERCRALVVSGVALRVGSLVGLASDGESA
jgi:hypothetical protein